MTAELIKQIPQYGFPIILCLLMAFGVWKVLIKLMDRFLKGLDDITETNKELSKTNQELSKTNQELIKNMDSKIDGMKSDIEKFIIRN